MFAHVSGIAVCWVTGCEGGQTKGGEMPADSHPGECVLCVLGGGWEDATLDETDPF